MKKCKNKGSHGPQWHKTIKQVAGYIERHTPTDTDIRIICKHSKKYSKQLISPMMSR